ncbi:MAG: hypothetical protein ACLU85_13995 [Lachnospirales bacterium]
MTETEPAGNGTGAGLRASMTRSCPIKTEKRPDGMKPYGRMK